MIIYRFPFGPLKTNAILIGCPKTKKGAVIDPSLGSTAPILEKAKKHNLSIEKILLTHSHWDHFADAFEMKQATGARLYVHPLDAKNVEQPGADGLPLFFSISPVIPDQLVQEGDHLEVGHLQLEVIHTPGHSPGGVCYYVREQNVLFSGDTLFQGSFGNISLPTANPLHMWDSLRKLAQLPSETRVIPGHGEETSIGQENWLSQAQEIFAE